MNFDTRSMLEKLGARGGLIPMAQQYVFFLPTTSDPYAQGVILIVQALQLGLQRLGYPVEIDGGLGAKTAGALRKVSGPNWQQKSWVQLIGDVISAPMAGQQLHGYDILQSVGADDAATKESLPSALSKTPAFWIATLAFGYWLMTKKVRA